MIGARTPDSGGRGVLRVLTFLLVAVTALGCGGRAKPAAGELAALGTRFEAALRDDAEGRDEAALKKTLALAHDVVTLHDFAGADAAYALRGLLLTPLAQGDARFGGLAHRTGELAETARSLAASAKRGTSSGARPVLAWTASQLFEQAGLATDATRARSASGCVQAATISAPDSYRHEAIRELSSLSAAGQAWPGRSKSVFGALENDAVTRGLGCQLSTVAASSAPGARSVAVDVVLDGASEVVVHAIGGAFGIHLGGAALLVQRAGALQEDRHAIAGAAVEGDVIRLVVRAVADDGARALSLFVVDGDGNALTTHPVKAGSKANGRVRSALSASSWKPQQSREPAERAFAAHGLAARGQPREASALVQGVADAAAAHAELIALESASDLADSDRLDRQREALERLLAAWPRAWQAQVLLAENAGRRRGDAERAIATFRALGSAWQASDAPNGLVWSAWAQARRARLFDVAKSIEAHLPSLDTPWARELRLTHRELPALELAREACGAKSPTAIDLRCHTALAAAGKTREALTELERIATLRGAPRGDAHARMRLALALDDANKVTAIARDMSPGERTLALWFLTREDVPPARAALFSAAVRSEGAIVSLPALAPRASAASDTDFVATFDARGLAAVEADRKAPAYAEAPTLILEHAEHYTLEPNGLLHYWIGDVRRLSGTADVEGNAEARRPSIYGQATSSVRLRRILKKDGRSLLPDPTPMASQAHAELSQLEAGDYVLSVYEGFGLPGPTWNLGFDSPDLLPDRTAALRATLDVRWPSALAAQVYVHPAWGKAEPRRDGDSTRLSATVTQAKVRKIGEHLPRSQRAVHLSFSTTTWAQLAQAMGDEAARVTEPDAEVARFAREALAKAPSTDRSAGHITETVTVLSRAVGERVTRAIGANLTDYAVASAYGMTHETARSILTLREGSRIIVLRAALQSVGVKSDVVVAEQEPWSNGESYPPHPGRFVRPLLRVPAQGELREPLWVDADVPGAPLPPGRLSPELHGRLAVHLPGGAIEKLPESAFQVGEDEVDIRMTLDQDGNAKGEITLLLRGRLAQELSAAFERVVGQERDRVLRSLVAAWVAGATVDEAAYSDRDGIAVRARFTAGAYAERLNAATPSATSKSAPFVLPGHVALHFDGGGERSTLLERYGDSLAREGTLSLRDAVRYHVRRSVEIPAGYTLSRGPGPLHVEAPGLRAERSFQVSGADQRSLVDDVRVSLETQTIEGAQVGAFVAVLRQIDEGLLASMRIERR